MREFEIFAESTMNSFKDETNDRSFWYALACWVSKYKSPREENNLRKTKYVATRCGTTNNSNKIDFLIKTLYNFGAAANIFKY